MNKKDEIIKAAADRLMGWKLPADFQPDNGISFKRESDYEHPEFGRTKYEPIGTNLLTHEQATAMFEYCLGDVGNPITEQPAHPQQEPVAFIDMSQWPPIRWRDGMVRADVAPFDGQGLFFVQPQRKPRISEEAAEFKAWFDAWWIGDGDICKAVTNEVEQTSSYKIQYTLAFGAWMAAKEVAYGIKA